MIIINAHKEVEWNCDDIHEHMLTGPYCVQMIDSCFMLKWFMLKIKNFMKEIDWHTTNTSAHTRCTINKYPMMLIIFLSLTLTDFSFLLYTMYWKKTTTENDLWIFEIQLQEELKF